MIDNLVPTVEALPAGKRNLARGVPANAIAQAEKLSRRYPIIAPAVTAGKVDVVASVYDIASGAVSVVR